MSHTFSGGGARSGIKQGFTIIEVVLVLAIGGLIFLMVFVALPALQRSQRNTQRRDDMARLMTAIIEYQGNNRGKTPFNSGGLVGDGATLGIDNFVMRYLDPDATNYNTASGKATGCTDAFMDPDGTCYAFMHTYAIQYHGVAVGEEQMSWVTNRTEHYIHVMSEAKCSATEGYGQAVVGKNKLAIFYALEGGSIICLDNS